MEAGQGRLGLVKLAMIGDVLGLDLVVSVHPGGAPIRDAGHLRLMNRLRSRLPGEFRWRTEIPMPIMGDRRAIDTMIVAPRIDAGFELETRLLDAQALGRRVLLKQRDSALQSMVIVLPDTAINRASVSTAAPTLRPAFPLGSRAILAALRAGQTPTANGILFV
jgi:hypothetical protein